MASIQLIRSATLKISFGGMIFLIDPMLGEKGSFESYGNLSPNPISNLPIGIGEVLEHVETVLITHLHKDHFDDVAKEVIDKNMKVFCQSGDSSRIQESGFLVVEEVQRRIDFEGISIYRTDGKHGRGEILKHMGNVSGFVLKHKDEPTIYIVGDSIFNSDVKSAIDAHQPDYIITNSGGAFIPGFESDLILMNESETLELARYASNAKILPVHLEGLDHCTVNRASLQRAILSSEIDNQRIQILLDGESMELS